MIWWQPAADPRDEWNDPTTQNTELFHQSTPLMRFLLNDQRESSVAPCFNTPHLPSHFSQQYNKLLLLLFYWFSFGEILNIGLGFFAICAVGLPDAFRWLFASPNLVSVHRKQYNEPIKQKQTGKKTLL